jgi:hypothetical protein
VNNSIINNFLAFCNVPRNFLDVYILYCIELLKKMFSRNNSVIGCGFYKRVEEIRRGILELSLDILVLFLSFLGQQNKNGCFKKTEYSSIIATLSGMSASK